MRGALGGAIGFAVAAVLAGPDHAEPFAVVSGLLMLAFVGLCVMTWLERRG